jgi:glycosyltransferase involved in cell wall biosynthesis
MARKGLHTVLNALARLPASNWQLHVVGSHDVDPSYSAAMRHRANTLSISARISWHGRISDAQLEALLSQCDLLVMPSYEGFGIVYLEAMAYGLPVLSADLGAAPEIVDSGINGYLVPVNDDMALARYLTLLLSNRVQVATLGYHARLRYDRHPTWQESMASVFLWLRENILGNRD